MATRCLIAIRLDDGGYASIYCHNDGYPANILKILKAHYKKPAKIYDLMELGSLSSLGPQIGEKHDFNDHDEHPEWEKWCLSYKRDREEPDCDLENSPSIEEVIELAESYGAEFLYTFENDRWTVEVLDEDDE